MDMSRNGSKSGLAHGLFTFALLSAVALSVFGCSPSYPKCDQDKDCHKGEFCVNKLCQQCRGDQDCGAGQRCASGACQAVPGYCTSSGQCGVGQDCVEHACVTQTQSVAPPAAPTPVAGQCELAPVYFDFDSSTVADSARSDLQRDANCIRERGIKSVHVTGMTDPRGTEEYNLALGDHRAQSAQQYLKTLGTDATMSYSSMGEEQATGTDEASWAKDRRVEIKAK